MSERSDARPWIHRAGFSLKRVARVVPMMIAILGLVIEFLLQRKSHFSLRILSAGSLLLSALCQRVMSFIGLLLSWPCPNGRLSSANCGRLLCVPKCGRSTALSTELPLRPRRTTFGEPALSTRSRRPRFPKGDNRLSQKRAKPAVAGPLKIGRAHV